MDGHLNGKFPNSSPPSSPPQPPQKEKYKRNKWTREEYKEVIYANYYALGRPSQERHTANTYSIWRTQNQVSRSYLDENKLTNGRRNILRNNRLTDSEISAIKHATENDINIRHKGNEESNEQYSPPRGLIERLPSDQSTQRPEDTRNSIEPVKESQENDKTTVTEDLAFAEEHRESIAEMRQKNLNTLEVKNTSNDAKGGSKEKSDFHRMFKVLVEFSEKMPKKIGQSSYRGAIFLTAHGNIPPTEKPYHFGICGISFFENSHLTKHKHIRTVEKAHQWDICRKSFY
ncbi:zinc finger 239-like [Octopus vulgaris]|uniref:Zinc finger 239-like n=1 Tax=Octopus vulgaris TaxID=6645 RepID=A0AA36BLP7_OCTVU|nr:zinc finger 239-like [Octopus vulgaris]